jgi:hypothetical protein
VDLSGKETTLGAYAPTRGASPKRGWGPRRRDVGVSCGVKESDEDMDAWMILRIWG